MLETYNLKKETPVIKKNLTFKSKDNPEFQHQKS